jgi:hypothetical protein
VAQGDQVGPGPVPAAQHPDGQQRVGAAALDHRERGQQHHGGGQRRDHLGVAPRVLTGEIIAQLAAIDEAEDRFTALRAAT